jgi:hypothetical protein
MKPRYAPSPLGRYWTLVLRRLISWAATRIVGQDGDFGQSQVGHPALAQHLYALVGFQRASASWDQFMTNVDLAFPRRGDTLKMPFMAEMANKK